VCSLADRDPRDLREPLQRAWRQLAGEGTSLAIGASTALGAGAVGVAYHDARAAVERLPREGGVLSLPDVRVSDFLTLRPDDTALRVIDPSIREFIEQEKTLTNTVLEDAAADMNARVAAERLFIHVNTAYQRLERIAERTGLDMRRFADVQELLVAIKLVRATSGTRPV
jgi:sugar diacid utilization regulator